MAIAGPSSNGPSSSLPGGGPAPVLQLRSKGPLPLFTLAYPVPPATSTIGATLKLSVLRLLTGEVTSKSSTAPMTESENLKLMTIHGWRMEMIGLELRQNVLIAPETREKIGEGADDELQGFDLADDADCGLLEEGDEVVIRLKPAFSLPDLHLPKLPKNHVYALPAGSLTRAGTLSNPPPYSQANIRRAAEPSSHSSSVQGQPNVNYNRQHHNYSKGYRVVTVPTANGGTESRRLREMSNPGRPFGLGNGIEPPAANPPPTTYRPTAVKQRRSSSNQKDLYTKSGAVSVQPAVAAASNGPSSVASPAPTPTPSQANDFAQAFGAAGSSTRPRATQTPTSTTISSATTPTSPVVPSNPRRQSAAAPTPQSQDFGLVKPAAQEAMPAGALLIGPGVQGAVGQAPQRPKQRRQSSHSSNDKAAKEKRREHLRTETHDVPLPSPVGSDVNYERPSDPARAAVEAAERRAAAARAARMTVPEGNAVPFPPVESPSSPDETKARPVLSGKDRRPSGNAKTKRERVELPELPSHPPIVNLAPFPASEGPKTAARSPVSSPIEVERSSGIRDRTASNEAPSPRRIVRLTQSSATQNEAAGTERPREDGEVKSGFFSSAFLTPMLGLASSKGKDDEAQPTSPAGSPALDATPSSPPQSRRPSNARNVSQGAVSTTSEKTKKKEGRFARLARPGLGGLGPLRRSSTKASIPLVPEEGRPDHQDAVIDSGHEEQQFLDQQRDRGAPLPSPHPPGGWHASDDAVAENDEVFYDTFAAEQDLSRSYLPQQGDREEDIQDVTSKMEQTKTSDNRNLSRAERRYLEFQKLSQAEVIKQQQAEETRRKEREQREIEKAKEVGRKEEEARQRKEKQKWEIWEEVRKREG